MNAKLHVSTRAASLRTSELLILEDGKILAHNLTPALAQLLSALNPSDQEMNQRIQSFEGSDASHLPVSMDPGESTTGAKQTRHSTDGGH